MALAMTCLAPVEMITWAGTAPAPSATAARNSGMPAVGV